MRRKWTWAFWLVVFFVPCRLLALHHADSALIKNLLHYCEQVNDTNAKGAESAARKSLQLTRGTNLPELFSRSMLALAKALWAQGRYAESSRYVDSLAAQLPNLRSSSLQGDVHFVMGRCDHYRGDYDKALENYFAALRFSEMAQDTVRLGEVCNTLGGIYYNQGDGKTAYDWYRKSLNIQLRIGNHFRSGRGYLNTGSALILQKKLKAARRDLDSSLHYYNKINSLEGVSYVYGTLPLIYMQQQQNDSALKYLLMARDATLKVNKLYALGQVNQDIARIYLAKGQPGKGLFYIDEGLRFCHQTRQNFEQMGLYQLKAEVLEKTGNTKQALENYKLYKAYSDSVLNATSIKKQTEEALNYEYNKRQYEQKLSAEKEALARTEKENRQKLVVYSVLIILLITAGLLYFRYRTKKKAGEALEEAYAKLKQKNTIIEENTVKLRDSLAERELLLKEIHHRVKNNLQVISGLLELQKEELTEEGSRAAFDEGQSRVRSISLIHQNLYQNEHLGSVEFGVFVKELIQQVKEVFESLDRRMQVQTNIPSLILDIDTAVPLGLILNELLTNSYKYAANKDREGHIHIVLEAKGQGLYTLTYSDDGPGMKQNTDLNSAQTLGLRLIRGLAGQLGGQASYAYANGAVFTVELKDRDARQND